MCVYVIFMGSAVVSKAPNGTLRSPLKWRSETFSDQQEALSLIPWITVSDKAQGRIKKRSRYTVLVELKGDIC